jgi:hypothetical protein
MSNSVFVMQLSLRHHVFPDTQCVNFVVHDINIRVTSVYDVMDTQKHSQTDIWFLKHSITAFWIHQRLSAGIIVLNQLRYKRNQTAADQITWPVISSAVIESSSDVFHIKPAVFPVHVTNWICHHFSSHCFPGRQGSRWLRNSLCSRVPANCVRRLIVPEEEHEERLSELIFLCAYSCLMIVCCIAYSSVCYVFGTRLFSGIELTTIGHSLLWQRNWIFKCNLFEIYDGLAQ